ncbi:MAG: hypothetical protein EYC70_02315 [Planctomycetota bacterium]|nr:MAG: hypothetical protein EYC70_02315 [Planctomycetota bacterium]
MFLAAALFLAQAPTWERQAPLPTGSHLTGVQMLSADEVWACSWTGEIMHSTDRGLSWQVRQLATNDLQALFFLDPQRGWTVGNGIFRTTDGGQTWTKTSEWGTLSDIWFLDAQRGWGCGNGGTTYRTSDGGLTWSYSTVGDIITLSSIFFQGPLTGWTVNIDGQIYRTTDGGASWQLNYSAGLLTNLTEVWFADALEGWVCGGQTVLHTVNGGASWTPLATPPGTWTHSTFFLDRFHSWGAGEYGNIVATTDGWQTVTTQRQPGSGPRLWCISFADAQHGMVVGEGGGLILYTADGGAHWVQRSSGGGYEALGMDTTDVAHAWIASRGSGVLRSADGGARWEHVPVPGTSGYGAMSDVDFLSDQMTGWAVGHDSLFGGDPGLIAGSTDGGRSWTVQHLRQADSYVESVAALDGNTAVAVGNQYFPPKGGFILRTSDGGQSWTDIATGIAFLESVHFADATTGWASGGKIYKTVNGGLSWTEQFALPGYASSIHFAGLQNGWVVGDFGMILRSTDGGSSWVDRSSPAITVNLGAVFAVDSNTAWVSGYGDYLWRTEDGGLSWQREAPGPVDPVFPGSFSALAFVDGDFGWAAGAKGVFRRSAGDPPGLALLHGRVGRELAVDLTASGFGAGEAVYFLYSLAGIGAGPCPAQLGGLCLDLLAPLQVLGNRNADGAGRAVLPVNVPARAPLLEVHLQAVAARGTQSVKTNSTSALIEP